MKTLVAGGAGFIGSHLCDALLEEGHTVVCVDDLSRGTEENIGHLKECEAFRFYRSDVREVDALKTIFEKEKPEYVFHLVANSDIQASAKSPEVEYQCTYTTTFNILQCMKEFGVKKLFFASTSAVYGDKRGIELTENTPNLSPVSYYGAAKLGSEALISAYSYMDDIQALIFRFPNVIGPRLTHGVIYDFIRKLNDNSSRLEILGDGKQTKPYIYVKDLVQAIVSMKESEQTGVRLYNLGVDSSTSVTRIADILCEEMELENVEYCYTGGEAGWKGDVPRFQYCLDKIHAAGWRAQYDSDEAVRMAVKHELGKLE
ncbi:MAG: SDR family NAD(P)-dependent oxidoreductase [Lachnospiraceae bacterium]|nr:SDR family NAD(P)-dependent oxidoreductase [Lachnospiraceae bacterium]